MAHTCDVFSGSQESYTNLMVDCTNEYISEEEIMMAAVGFEAIRA